MIDQSTAYTYSFLMVLTSDHLTGATGKTVAVQIAKAGASFAAAAGAVSEIGLGWYKCALTSADTNTLGDLAINAQATACDTTDAREQIRVPAATQAPTVAAIRGEMDSNSTKLALLDVATSTRLATAGYTVAPSAIANADALLDRDMAVGADTIARSPRNALRSLRNKVSRAGSTLTIYKEDDTATAWSATITTSGAAVPITVVDPA